MSENKKITDQESVRATSGPESLYAVMDYTTEYSGNLPALLKHLDIRWRLRPTRLDG